MMMLEGLDTISWHQLTDAYGPSRKTPALLRALASNDCHRREGALDELSCTIYHQGSVYEATVYAVPFLLQMLAQPGYSGKVDVLTLLRWIADGTSYHDVHQHLVFMNDQAATPEYQAKVQKEKGWVAQIATEIRDRLDLLLTLIRDDPDPAVRVASVELLSRVKDAQQGTRAPLTALLADDPDPAVRAVAIATLAAINRNDAVLWDLLRRRFDVEADPTCRATIAILLCGREGTVDQQVLELCRAIACRETAGFREANHVLGEWEEAAALALAGREHPPEIVERMIAVLERGPIRERFATAVLILLLGQNRGPWRSEDFTPLQRRGIAAVAGGAFPEPATVYANLVDVLELFNLPRDRVKVEALIQQKLPARYRPRPRPAKRNPWWKLW